MSASTTDKITDVRNGVRPNSARASGTRAAGGTSLAADNLAGWPDSTKSKVHYVTYQLDTDDKVIAGTQLDCYGIVTGNTINSIVVVDGDDTGNGVNDVIEMLPTAAWGQDLADALTKEHDRTGTHTSAVTLRVLAAVYPVGSIYSNANNPANPATLLGFGNWSAFAAGEVTIGAGTSDQAFTAGATGGESTHVLTTNEMPSHTHVINYGAGTATSGAGFQAVRFDATSTSANTGSTGSGAAHNNLQPYIVVYMWLRTG